MNTVFVRNKCRDDIQPLSVGTGAPTRVVANVGITSDYSTKKEEIEKASRSVVAGADVVADHTLASETGAILSELMEKVKVPISTVPYYQAAIRALKERSSIVKVYVKELLQVIKDQASLGVDIMTLHASITRKHLQLLSKSNRIMKICSRGGSWVASYMIHERAENPMYEHLDEILDIMKSNGVTLSVGASLRSGSVVDGLDNLVLVEIVQQAEIVNRALKKGVQVMVEGSGHIPADLIPAWVKLVKNLCSGVPLRPLIIATDVASGYDHIASAIAGTLAAMHGADILVAMTRAEHLGLPRMEDVVEGVVASKIAAHIADISKYREMNKDKLVSIARRRRDWNAIWENAIDGQFARRLYEELLRGSMETDYCTMCGPLCAHKIIDEFLSENDLRHWSKNKNCKLRG